MAPDGGVVVPVGIGVAATVKLLASVKQTISALINYIRYNSIKYNLVQKTIFQISHQFFVFDKNRT